MFRAVKKYFPRCDCLIMAAAVSDYTPQQTSAVKLKKAKAALTIKLKPTKDILAWAGKNKKHQAVIGFALEDKNLRANAEEKLRNKKLDMIVANTPAAIGAQSSTVHIKTTHSKWTKIKAAKTTIAAKIVRQAEALK